jgi:hypothetical protein
LFSRGTVQVSRRKKMIQDKPWQHNPLLEFAQHLHRTVVQGMNYA